MDPYMPMSNSTALLPWVRLLLLLRGPAPQQSLDNALRDVAPPLSRSMYRGPTPTCPGFYYAQLNSVSFLLIDGATAGQQAVLLTAGYVGTAHPAITNPSNFYLRDAATEIVTALRDQNFAPPVNIRICGYSTGGAIGPFVPFEIRRQEWGDDRGNVLSFGAPKTAGFRNNQTLHVNDRLTRIMNDGDPVPLFPPSALDFPALLGMVGPIHAARLSNFTHAGQGTVLFSDGTMQAANLPSGNGIQFGVNLATWLWATEERQDNFHSLTEYEKRLMLMEGANARAVHIPQAHIQRNEEVARQEMNDVERRVADTIAHSGAVQGHDPVVLPKDKIFQWVRVGRINCVSFGDKLVTITNTKKRAIRLANSGNDFLRTLQKQAVVDPVAITMQFEQYFLYAAAIGNGFQPVMQTVFPAIGN